MRQSLRLRLSALFAGCVLSAAVLAQPPVPARTTATERVPAPAANARTVAATVNGEVIREGAIQRALRRLPPDRHAEARAPILNLLVENVLIEQYLQQTGLQVAPAEVDKKLEEMKGEIKKEKLDYANVLKDMDMDEVALKKELAAFIRWEKYCDAQASDKALRELFAANKEMFDGSAVRVRHILLSPDGRDAKKVQEAKATLASIKASIESEVAGAMTKVTGDALTREKTRCKLVEDAFAAQAKAKSACPSKQQGGDVGWFDRSGMMVEPFSKAAFALRPFQISDIVESQFGYHLILLLDRKPGKDIKFEDVKANVKDVYLDRMRETLVQGLRARAKIVQAR